MMDSKEKITLKDAMAIGIGGMVGGGIFAVLGLAVEMSQGATPLAFLLAGTIALLTSYSYVKLSISFPSRGGTVNFINKGFGKNIFSGGTNNLLWISYIIMLSLYASAFGAYGAKMIHLTGDYNTDKHLLLSGVVLFSTLLNYISFKAVSLTESFAVFIKMIILGGFILAGGYGLLNSEFIPQLSPAHWETPLHIISGGMVIFVAYEGFELIANATPNLTNPRLNIPKAFYYSTGIVVVLYMLIAIITVGSVSFEQIGKEQEYVLAVAARPVLGKIGFTIISVTAMISTFSAINATLYGGSRVNYQLARDDELPHEFTKHYWNQPIGLLVTSILTLVLANGLNLESISTVGSAGFLWIFALVNLSNFRLARHSNSNKVVPVLGGTLCLLALIALLIQQFDSSPLGVVIAGSIFILSYGIEFLYKKSESKAGKG
jgi:amino acid transporter